ncbi:hypothetical protein PC129_g18373 [Phytophthora cactorum]|uniref:Uncharacterized protein n=1 Tax=Phytophthora cactorum TaxID=29920 RepID=A0A329RIR7_9STRA|nr:hypothetical protein Pcac1_g1348 [Phytophthora cactorum]KAG2837207.1 hypothetical protein PC111_g4715 [Phytophthora cactorum]KAG2837944.1 hypothetical protein PC112_g4726 [Phytophthora cactorum]KAG2862784.1 hypothetical protein PC113_g6004 [Phytophthora cactorum]KAG2893173.1 hypothetical protein PC115_g18562 [Phytophthora cactorum]
MSIDSCIVEGCTSEFLLGVDFMRKHEANMENELQCHEAGRTVVIHFRTFDKVNGAKVAAVRMATKTRVGRGTVMLVEITVAAEDGDKGVFIPSRQLGSVMLVDTVTQVRNDRVWIPAINAGGDRVKLPSTKELGTWIPLDANAEVLEMNGALKTNKLMEWLDQLGDGDEPLPNEDKVHVGTDVRDSRALGIRLLRAYRRLVTNTDDCAPSTALDVEHHIDTGNAAPIMPKRRRQAQSEDALVTITWIRC